MLFASEMWVLKKENLMQGCRYHKFFEIRQLWLNKENKIGKRWYHPRFWYNLRKHCSVRAEWLQFFDLAVILDVFRCICSSVSKPFRYYLFISWVIKPTVKHCIYSWVTCHQTPTEAHTSVRALITPPPLPPEMNFCSAMPRPGPCPCVLDGWGGIRRMSGGLGA